FTQEDGITKNTINALAPGLDQTLWIAAGRGLLKYWHGKLEDAIPRKNALHDRWFCSLLVDSDGTVWDGTLGDGLARIRNGDISDLCNTTHGLFSDEFFALLKDDRGYLWATSNRGVFATKISELNEFFDGKVPKVNCRVFTKADGLLTAECM